MNSLRISLFGRMQITHQEQELAGRPSRLAYDLLAYLLLNGRRYHPRERLVNLFWPDHAPNRARNCLSTTLWRLRRRLEPGDTPPGTYLLTSAKGDVSFNWASDHWLDVVVFETELEAVITRPLADVTPQEIDNLATTLDLYSENLLEGVYRDWAVRERERLRQRYLAGQAYLMQYYGNRGVYEKSLTYGQQILSLDPLRENIHRELMRLHWQHGQVPLAVRQYQTCRQVLASQLDIAPMTETQALYLQIIGVNSETSVSTESHVPTLHQALRHLEEATSEFRRARAKLEQATRLVEQATRQQSLSPEF